MKTKNIKIGDGVITTRFGKQVDKPNFVSEMKAFIHKEGEVTSIHKDIILVHGYWWPESACELVTETDTSEQLILVPEIWFKSLLELSDDMIEARKNYEWGKSIINDKMMFKVAALVGHSQSAKSIILHSERK